MVDELLYLSLDIYCASMINLDRADLLQGCIWQSEACVKVCLAILFGCLTTPQALTHMI